MTSTFLSIAALITSEKVEELNWMKVAKCQEIDPEAFFADGDTLSGSAQHLQAEETCQGCTVRLECLKYGLEEEFGVWGGIGEEEREHLRTTLAKHHPRVREVLIQRAANRGSTY